MPSTLQNETYFYIKLMAIPKYGIVEINPCPSITRIYVPGEPTVKHQINKKEIGVIIIINNKIKIKINR